MKNMIRVIAVLAFAAMLLPNLSLAQAMPVRPFHDGPVWDITFVKAKPGVGLKYMELPGDGMEDRTGGPEESRADPQLHGHQHRGAQSERLRPHADDPIQGPGYHGSQPGQGEAVANQALEQQ